MTTDTGTRRCLAGRCPACATILAVLLPTILASAASRASAQGTASFDRAREQMVRQLRDAGITDPRVLDSMGKTPRHEFVLAPYRNLAYEDMTLPIGGEQTISSTFIVAYMTQTLDPQPTDKVLEIGTGSGFQAAVLSPLVKEVYTIEIVEQLARQAERTLQRLRYANVFVKAGDGYQGWTEHAPFDKIIVTCSPEKIPQPLVDQLRDGGLMIIPIGQRYQQTLVLLKKKDGRVVTQDLRPILFVPMTGTAEDNRQVQPDPLNPQLVNADFEQGPTTSGFLPGWHFQRQFDWDSTGGAPQGDHYVTFSNSVPGKSAHLLQGFPVDGRQVAHLEIRFQMRAESIRVGQHPDELPAVAVTFYDRNRKDLGARVIGPFRDTSGWSEHRETIRVPVDAREAIFRIGLFGATGRLSLDDIRLTAHRR